MNNEVQPVVIEEMRSLLATELQERRINPAFIPIVNAHLAGSSVQDIARQTGLNVLEVSLVLEKQEIRNYINQMVLSYGYLNRLKRVDLIEKVIQKILDDSEEYETPLTKKDLLDWLKLSLKESKAVQTENKGTGPRVQVNTQVNNNMTKLITELLEDN